MNGERPVSSEAAEPNRISAWQFSAVHALGIALFFGPVLIGMASFFYRDFALFGYPLAHFHKEAFWRGELPFWNPFNYFGMPFMAQWNTLTLYPPSLIYLLLPLPWSLNLFCLAHLFMAGLGMYFLARSWTQSTLAASIAGAAYAWSGVVLNSLKWPNNIAALGLMPWIVWLARRGWTGSWRDAALAALAGAVQMLSGAPEIIVMTWMVIAATAALDLARRPNFQMTARLLAIPALVALISAAQLLPFFDLLGQSQRTVQQETAHWAMPLWGLANFFLPIFNTVPSYHGVPAQVGQYWTAGYYLPLAVFCAGLLAVRSRRTWDIFLLAGLSGLALVLSLGEAGWLYTVLIEPAPMLSFMRFPIKFVVLVGFCLALLGAFGIADLQAREASLLRFKQLIGLCIGLVALVTILQITQAQGAAGEGLMNGALRVGCLIAAGFLIIRAVESPLAARWVATALLGLIILDGATHLPRHNPTVPSHVFTAELTQQPAAELGKERAMLLFETERMLNHLIPKTAEEDVLASRAMLFCNLNLIDRRPKNDGFFSLYLKESAQVHYALQQTNIDRASAMRALNVLRVSDPEILYEWEALANPLPFAYGGQAPRFGGAREFFGAVARGEFEPAREIIFEEADQPVLQNVVTGKVTTSNLTVQDERLALDVQAESEAVVFIAQSFHPGWHATIDGAPVHILRANHAFQALVVPAGKSRVELWYVEPKFKAGLILSALGLGLVARMAWFGDGKRLGPSTNRL